MLSNKTLRVAAGSPKRQSRDSRGGSGIVETRRQIRECEKPEPSATWQTLGITFAGFAFAIALGALTLAEEVAVRSLDLWIMAAGLLLATILCFAAHRDVNRGRRSRWVEVEEVPQAEDSLESRRGG